MKTKQDLHRYILYGMKAYCLVLLLVVAGCTGKDEPNMPQKDKPELSDTPIKLQVDDWKPLKEARAVIYDDKLFHDKQQGGGNFTLHAYHQDDNDANYLYDYLPGTRLSYVADKNIWVFLSGEKEITHYWPNWGRVSFFAYMPYKDYTGKNTYVTMGEYTNTGGQAISCQMPVEVDVDDANSQEYMFAYTPNKTRKDGTVSMHFVHPFAAIYLKLKQAHRDLTINSVMFNRIFTQGTYSQKELTTADTDVAWKSSGNMSSFTIKVDKTIPEDLNFSADIGGPYLVMPQTFGTDAVITVNYTWKGETKEFDTNLILKDKDGNKVIEAWESGKKYTYILDLGDNKEEILFKVLVEPWTGEYKNEIDVE